MWDLVYKQLDRARVEANHRRIGPMEEWLGIAARFSRYESLEDLSKSTGSIALYDIPFHLEPELVSAISEDS
jgi:hypothetical protein